MNQSLDPSTVPRHSRRTSTTRAVETSAQINSLASNSSNYFYPPVSEYGRFLQYPRSFHSASAYTQHSVFIVCTSWNWIVYVGSVWKRSKFCDDRRTQRLVAAVNQVLPEEYDQSEQTSVVNSKFLKSFLEFICLFLGPSKEHATNDKTPWYSDRGKHSRGRLGSLDLVSGSFFNLRFLEHF